MSRLTRSADAMQPGHRGAVGSAAEGLQRIIPGGTEQLVELMCEGLRVAGRGRQRPQLVLADHDVTIGTCAGSPQSKPGYEAESLSVQPRTGFLSDLETKHRP